MMSLLHELNTNATARLALHVPEHYETSEWVVTAAYYAMYMAASAVLAKLGYRSKSHEATILCFETFLVKKQLLEPRYVAMINEAHLGKKDVEQLRLAKERRKTAQYSPTLRTTRALAQSMREDAYAFVGRMERFLG